MLARTTRQYATMPSLPGRGPLPPMVSVIVPLARINLITNPSVELATTGYTNVGGSIARVATQQYHGTYSLEITPSAGTNSDGAFYGTVSLTTGIPYAYSVKFKATGAGIGKTYALSIATTGGTDLSVTQFVATGRWQWIKGIYGETSTTTRRVYIRKVNHSAASVFYTDGWQVESCADGVLDATTYIDGDQQGLLIGQQPPPYLWTGTPHASTSTRSALTRAGGYVVNLSFYNFLLASIVGLGMAVPNNVSIPYTILDGARYQRTQKPPRTIALAGRFQADNVYELMQAQSDMRAVFDRDFNPIQQPLLLQIEPQDECGNVIGDFATIQCLYAGGLEGNDGNYPAEDVAPTFTMYLPYLIGGEAGAALTLQQNVTNANAIIQRTPSGTWQALGTGMSGGTNVVRAIVYGLDNTLYAGGNFTDAGGSGADYLAKWDGSAWSVVRAATAINGDVFALAVGPDGKIYVGGSFTNADGIANADAIAVYDPVANTYAALGTGGAVGANVLALAFDSSGNLWAGGAFTAMGGVANTANLARWNGSAWQSLGAGGINGTVNTIVSNNAGSVYIGGLITQIAGVAFDNIGRYNGTAWVQVGAGVSNEINVLTIGPNGDLYIGGAFFTEVDNYVMRWNGGGFFPLGSGVDGEVLELTFDAAGMLYASGAFSMANGVTLPDRAARWNGSAWTSLDVDMPGTALPLAIVVGRDGSLTIGFNTTGTATASVPATVTNSEPGLAYPTLTLRGPTSGSVRIYQLENYTTGVGVYFNYTIFAGETARFNFDPNNPIALSDFQGNVSGKILPGSGLLALNPGANTLAMFASNIAGATATLQWQRRYNGVADLVN